MPARMRVSVDLPLPFAPSNPTLVPEAACAPTVLEAGVNLAGFSAPVDDLSCFDVLTAFGDGIVSAVERSAI